MPPLATGEQRIGDRSISIVSLVAALIEEAHLERASDIHIDPTPLAVQVRMRIDGLLSNRHTLAPHIHPELIARVKVLAKLRTDEHNTPQDGRFRHTFGDGTWIDVRVSIMPTYHGENAVLRLLVSTEEALTLGDLGFDDADRERISEALKGNGGMILSTGPTGSGKTTTLYALMRMLRTPERSIVTIEDPIEYAVEGVRQIPVNYRTGLTFAAGLRALLRQDPDCVMVGEIRDIETASVAVNTALTGHLVLSSLHTTNAAGALPRLIDMKIEPYLIASTVKLVIAQRLVRRICAQCAQAGCDTCKGTGYRGRTCIYELLAVDERVREAITRRASSEEIGKLAKIKPFLTEGLEKAAAGITSKEEVLRNAYE